ncbi:MAG TPA: GIY-YIG nuclease family protein [Bacteroidales bacterium]|nr:GIY-YIG nuclease family protein [Bacteroidales bacterium]
MYILQCADGSYYTGSTKNLERRLKQHQNGEGANHTKKHLPVKLVYFEEFQSIAEAFYREKQIQGWSRKKKEALINSWGLADPGGELHRLSECTNESHYKNYVPFDSAQGKAQGTDTSFDSAQGTGTSFDSAQGTGTSFGSAQGKDVSFGSAQGKDVSFDSAQGKAQGTDEGG